MGAWLVQSSFVVYVGLTEMRSSLVLTRALLRFQDTEGSGWPRGGTHSNTAGSPAATTTSLGAWRKSSLRTKKKTQRNLISFRSPLCLMYLEQSLEIRPTDRWAAAQTHDHQKKRQFVLDIIWTLFSWVNHLIAEGWLKTSLLEESRLLCLHLHDCANPWQHPC